MPVRAWLLIDVALGELERVSDAISRLSAVKEYYVVDGAHDLVVLVEARDEQELATLISDRLARLRGVKDVLPHVVVAHASNSEESGEVSVKA